MRYIAEGIDISGPVSVPEVGGLLTNISPSPPPWPIPSCMVRRRSPGFTS